MTRRTPATWTNKSVLALAGGDDPLEAVTRRAQEVALQAIEEGWQGPPYDPFTLARMRNIAVVAHDGIRDARAVPGKGGKIQIEFNPTRPRGRVRFSVAHELAHTLFPDCADAIRNRTADPEGDEWQLEMLCNVAASELLMPAGAFPELEDADLEIERLMVLRKEFDVSAEALLLRVAKLSDEPGAVFAASRVNGSDPESELFVEYLRPTRAWDATVPVRAHLPKDSVTKGCTAVGFTAVGEEHWPGIEGQVDVECVGIPPHPGHRLPRVVGIVRPQGAVPEHRARRTRHVRGDASDPRGEGTKIIAHVINDRARSWRGGFANALQQRWPNLRDTFRQWIELEPENLSLGRVFQSRVADDIYLVSMVAQKGYGDSATTRLRYRTLRDCLEQVAGLAVDHDASVHMPRIGAGEAGGEWRVISELIDETLAARDIPVTVYTLPGQEPVEPAQSSFLIEV